jgi:flagellar motor switch protein FliG
MAKFQGGLQEMIKAIELMDGPQRDRLMIELAKRDPEMVRLIKSSLHSLSDLQYLTPKMFVDFLTNIKVEDLALALKLESKDLQEHIKCRLSSRNAQLIDDVLSGPKHKKSLCVEAEARILSIMRKMIDDKTIIISKDDQFV